MILLHTKTWQPSSNAPQAPLIRRAAGGALKNLDSGKSMAMTPLACLCSATNYSQNGQDANEYDSEIAKHDIF
jgi:hypothetical protein